MSLTTIELPNGRRLTGLVIERLTGGRARIEYAEGEYVGRRVCEAARDAGTVPPGRHQARPDSAVSRQRQVDAGLRDGGRIGCGLAVSIPAVLVFLWLIAGMNPAAVAVIVALSWAGAAVIDHAAVRRIEQAARDAETYPPYPHRP